MAGTNYSKSNPNASGYGKRNFASGELLLEDGNALLQENGNLEISLEDIGTTGSNYTKSSPNATNYS